MNEIKTTQYNLDAHYSKKKKKVSPAVCVADAPQEIKQKQLFDGQEADRELKKVHKDVYNKKMEKKQETKTSFLKFLLVTGASILAFLGIKKLIK